MKILYIDTPNSVDKIRIAEQTIIAEEFINLGHVIHYLLTGSKQHDDKVNNIFRYKNTIFTRLILNFPLIFSIKKTCRNYDVEIIIVRNELLISFISLLYAKFNNIHFVYIKAFPITELIKINSYHKKSWLLKTIGIISNSWFTNQNYEIVKSTYVDELIVLKFKEKRIFMFSLITQKFIIIS